MKSCEQHLQPLNFMSKLEILCKYLIEILGIYTFFIESYQYHGCRQTDKRIDE